MAPPYSFNLDDPWAKQRNMRLNPTTTDLSVSGVDAYPDIGKVDVGDLGGGTELGWNTGTLGAAADIAGGIGNLANAYMAFKNYGLAEKSMEAKQAFANKNLEAQRITTNNRIRGQQAWLEAQGRSPDLSKLVV